MNILIPIVEKKTEGERKNGENQYIRGLYEVRNKMVLQYVYESLNQIKNAQFILVIQKEDTVKYHLDEMLRWMIPGCKVIIADGVTKGSACSCLLAIDEVEEDQPLVIAGGNQLMLKNPQEAVSLFQEQEYDGGTVIFDDFHPRWSYVRLNSAGLVSEAAEKRPISRNATTGFYYFRKAEFFIRAAQEMIRKNADVNGQYYVCPCFNEMILEHRRIGTYRIERVDYFNFRQQRDLDEYERYLKKKEKYAF